MTPDSRSLGTVISDLAAHAREIVRGELRLAGAELAANLRPLRRGLILIALAGFFAAAALAYLLVSALFALALVLPVWAAALTMALATLLITGLLAWSAMRCFKRVRGFPRTLTSLQDATRWPQPSSH